MKLHPSNRILFIAFIIFLSGCQPTQVSTQTVPTATNPVLPNPTTVSIPTATSPLPSPTVIQRLLHRMQDKRFSSPDGLLMDVYLMAGHPFPDEGYDPFINFLAEQSQLRSLTQGRYSWDTADLALYELDNAALAPFGYRLEGQPVTASTGARWFTLYQNDKVLLDPVTQLGQVSVNRSGTDFLLVVEAENHTQLVRKGSVETWKHMNGWIANSRPQFLGDDIMHVEIHMETPEANSKTPQPPSSVAEVFRNEQLIYTKQYQNRVAASGLIGFWTYENHWALETIDEVVIDGQEVNAINGYDKTFEFHLVSGKPLYFFEKSGKLSISYDNKTALLPFNTVPHYGCCSASLQNPLQIGNVLIFYGLQGKDWFYVEVTSQ